LLDPCLALSKAPESPHNNLLLQKVLVLFSRVDYLGAFGFHNTTIILKQALP